MNGQRPGGPHVVGASAVRERASAEAPGFRMAYAAHRAREGRGPLDETTLLALPHLRTGPLAREWGVRARSFEAFLKGVVAPLARGAGRPLRVLDLGSGNGWLSSRLERMGHHAVATDVRTDGVDGLGASAAYRAHLARMFGRVAASFQALPFVAGRFDLAVFNASLHYAVDLDGALAEAARVVGPGGAVAVLDSPFYRSREAGEAMALGKRADALRLFGEYAAELGRPRFIEYLTRERLAGARPALAWKRVRVLYPLWYEARPLLARLRGGREPSRFDVWWAGLP